jgi:hypothetical protein
MDVSETRDSVILTWNRDSKEDVDEAIKQYSIYLRKGWWPEGNSCYAMTDACEGTIPRSYFRASAELHMGDYLSGELKSGNTSLEEWIHLLVMWGFSPCLSTRGIGKKVFFRFHVDRARNFWADHKNAQTAAINALKLWKKAGRPLFEPLDTGAAPSEEKVVTKTLRLTSISPNFTPALVAHLHEKHSGKCLDNEKERKEVARSVIKFINGNLKTRAGVWK